MSFLLMKILCDFCLWDCSISFEAESLALNMRDEPILGGTSGDERSGKDLRRFSDILLSQRGYKL